MSPKGDFSRQSFLGADSEKILAACRVAVVGLGGGGSHIAQQLAHVGVGDYRLFDPQCIDASNLNRLVTATQADVDASMDKVRILERTVRAIRPWANVQAVDLEWTRADELLRDCHVVFGCVDTFRGRQSLERACRRFHIPYIDIGMNVTDIGADEFAVSGQMIMTRPGKPCMKCLGFLTRERLDREEDGYGDTGPAPQVVWSNGILASLAVGAFVSLVTPWHGLRPDYSWLEYEGNSQSVSPSRQPLFNLRGPCSHFSSPDDLGDPNFKLP
jgi:hypothetical protein